MGSSKIASHHGTRPVAWPSHTPMKPVPAGKSILIDTSGTNVISFRPGYSDLGATSARMPVCSCDNFLVFLWLCAGERKYANDHISVQHEYQI
jgi:hypothetical protein